MSKINNSAKWYRQKRWVFASLLLLPPLGIPLLWLTRWPKVGKISGSVLSGLLLLSALTGGANEPKQGMSANQSPAMERVTAPDVKPVPSVPPAAYEDAVSLATVATEELAAVKTSADWQSIARRWDAAIGSLNEVSDDSSYASQAQAKAKEYQRNYDYAVEQVEAIARAEEAEAIAEQQRAEEAAITEQRRAEEEVIAQSAPPIAPVLGGFVSGTCKDLRKQGVGSNFTPGDPNYSSSRDRDNDGIACES